MLSSSRRPQSETVSRLVNVWAARYRPDFSALEASARSLIIGEIYQLLKTSGCREISVTLNKQRVVETCKLAAVRSKDFYVYFDDLDLQEIITLAHLASRIYLQLFEFYQVNQAILSVSQWELEHFPLDHLGRIFKVPNISELAYILEPSLNEFRAHSTSAKDGKTLGFMTTQINLTNALLLQELDPVERALVSPYLKFLEEHMAVPWQRMCAAALYHKGGSTVFGIVERMVPLMSEISKVTHSQWSHDFPYYCNRRGRLDNPDVQHSSLRDFSMFQVYLWLSFLQGHSRIIDEELVVLCRVVYGQIGIPWEMTVKGTKLLAEKILNYLEPHELSVVTPCVESMLKAFICSDAIEHGNPGALKFRYP